MPNRKVRKRDKSNVHASGRRRAFIALGLILSVIVATAILAQRGKRKEPVTQNQTAGQQSTVSPAAKLSPSSLSPSLGLKDYVYLNGKVIATEERITFTDVFVDTPFYEDIYRIAARRVTLGCTATTYCPDQNVLRDQMAAFIMRALGEYDPPTPTMQRFDDVPPSHIFYKVIDRLAALGITVGCSTNPPLYCPSTSVTHEQMAAFMMRARGEFNPPTPQQQRFNDVPPSNPFYYFIERMGALDIWQGQGCPGTNNYCPSSPVTRRQMAHILVKAFGI
jgi:hypothetical protein